MHQLGQLKCQDFLGLVELAAFPFVHFTDLLDGKEGKHTQAFQDVRIVDISPVLVEIKG